METETGTGGTAEKMEYSCEFLSCSLFLFSLLRRRKSQTARC
jgi:hypothetical protein